MTKRPVILATPPKVLEGGNTHLVAKIKRVSHRAKLPISSSRGGILDEAPTRADLSIAFVECPYCDGENVVPGNRSGHSQLELPDCEIACKDCRALFLSSESKRGICYRSAQQSDVA